VWDIIGRSLAVHDGGVAGAAGGAAAVLARSAGVGENLKRVCQCDGTVIWESSPDDFTPVMVDKKKGAGGPMAGAGKKVSVQRG
jgi:copper chaperone for superoxide dismutase